MVDQSPNTVPISSRSLLAIRQAWTSLFPSKKMMSLIQRCPSSRIRLQALIQLQTVTARGEVWWFPSKVMWLMTYLDLVRQDRNLTGRILQACRAVVTRLISTSLEAEEDNRNRRHKINHMHKRHQTNLRWMISSTFRHHRKISSHSNSLPTNNNTNRNNIINSSSSSSISNNSIWINSSNNSSPSRSVHSHSMHHRSNSHNLTNNGTKASSSSQLRSNSTSQACIKAPSNNLSTTNTNSQVRHNSTRHLTSITKPSKLNITTRAKTRIPSAIWIRTFSRWVLTPPNQHLINKLLNKTTCNNSHNSQCSLHSFSPPSFQERTRLICETILAGITWNERWSST